MKKAILASLISVFVLTGCNTIKGFGQDISQAGDSVSETAQEVDNKL